MLEGLYIYALVQSNFPCFYLPWLREASVLEFENNSAGNKIGEHIYGVSIFSNVCMFEAFEFIPHEQDKLCYHKIIRLSPDLTQNLSPISSDPR